MGIGCFLGNKGEEFEREGLNEIERARKTITADDRQASRRRHEKSLRGIDVSAMPDPSQIVAAASYKFVKEIQARFGDQMIRRTIDSLTPDGTKINDKLPPCFRHPITIVLPEAELNGLHSELTRLADECVFFLFFESSSSAVLHLEISDDSGVTTSVDWATQVVSIRSQPNLPDDMMQNFYSTYRTLIAYPYPEISLKKKKTNWPTFNTIDEWKARPGMKMETALRILNHLLSHDGAPPPYSDSKGTLILPPLPEEHRNQPSRGSRKVLFFHEFSMMAHTLQSV